MKGVVFNTGAHTHTQTSVHMLQKNLLVFLPEKTILDRIPGSQLPVFNPIGAGLTPPFVPKKNHLYEHTENR